MADHATSSDPFVQAQLDRLARLSPGADILGLERITTLLARLGDPQLRLPPIFHVAGTNGKGSTCAYLRAALEADGRRVHVFTSPHLVRFNERIRLAGTLISDAMLAHYLGRVLDIAEGVGASFFEVTTAAAFLAFSEVAADALVLEVGLGGRLDATNVVSAPAVCGIAQLGVDHEAFLGSDIVGIAHEKAGIAKHGTPIVTIAHDAPLTDAIAEVAAAAGAPLFRAERDWSYAVDPSRDMLVYRDAWGLVETPLPALPGAHQFGNLALAIAMLRHQRALPISDDALGEAARTAKWPARLQRLNHGPLIAPLGKGADIWLDGGHNPAAGEALAKHFHGVRGMPMILGMLANKDASGFLLPLLPHLDSIQVVPVPGHDWHDADHIAAIAEPRGVRVIAQDDVPAAVAALATSQAHAGPVLIGGSLYLAGRVLEANGQLPD